MTKLYYLLLILSAIASTELCQNRNNSDEELRLDGNCKYFIHEGMKMYTDMDSFPSHELGANGLLAHFSSNYQLPKSERFQGRFDLEFLIGSSGELTDVRIIDKPHRDYSVSEIEAVRVMKLLESGWNPGYCKGEAVSSVISMVLRL